MAKKTPSYLSPSKLLSAKEYKEYIETKKIIAKRNLKQRIGELKSERDWRRRIAKQESTKSGKIGSALKKGFGILSQRGGVSRALYSKQLPPTNISKRFKTVQGTKSGRKGRPSGTYDQRYARYGGVYGFRKAMALERFKQRQAILERSATNPRQRVVLEQIRQRDNARMQDPERKTIPNTYGQVPLSNIFKEIDNASNIFP